MSASRRGFTLVEIPIVITLIAVVAGWAVTRFTNMNYRMDANIRMLQNAIIAAQQTAIARNIPVQLMFDASSDSAMRVFTPHYSGSNTGFRYHGAPDRCQATNRRPPFFPLTNRYLHIRTLEIEASRANTPPEIRALLLRLKGKAL